jgi:phosphatidylglycerophosphate synthase
MDKLAVFLDRITKSRITPNSVTLLSFLGHFAVFAAIIDYRFGLAAILIIFFGLLDALDGSLARIQKKASPAGMLLDATSDRAKEFIIYLALIFVFADSENVAGVLAATCALGGSFMVSYVKAKGETAIASSNKNHSKVNRMFASGLMQYQVRMVILIIGLVEGSLTITVTIIAVLTWLTALVRLVDVVEAIQPKTKK